eukprot:CAMPEP_0168345638 /NCGR_PEP_ID=MMETSP0213-20121227/17700_1 /TAXON_ID=151035 /ORGANISM="Euplotes harpa, Strain FSP1.4" /LENGTH=85 /DNA_ID=CAMNT_0008353947 /DNA_START=553 /DNA_END=807 /DNA_ORIENTATION=+
MTVRDDWDDSPFEVIEKYNDHYKKLFMTSLTCARMFYFVFSNFLAEYWSLVKVDYRTEVVSLVSLLLNCYKRMRLQSHLDRICFL